MIKNDYPSRIAGAKLAWIEGFLYYFSLDDVEAERWFKNPLNFDDTEIVIYLETLWKDV